MEKQFRGALTQRVKDKSKELMGYEISLPELRLIPYLLYTLANDQRLEPKCISDTEQIILYSWVEKGYILDGVTKGGRPMISNGVYLKVSKEFYDIMCELLYLAYVDIDHE